MKGTLLLLALLVTGELGFQTTEACAPFYTVLSHVILGNRALLHTSLSGVNATTQERVAFEKVQDCFNEAGLKTKILISAFMATISLSEDCAHFYTKDALKKIQELLCIPPYLKL